MLRVAVAAVLLSLAALCTHAHDQPHPLAQWNQQNARMLASSSVSVTVNTTDYTYEGQPVLVTISNSGNRTKADYISLYSPPNANPNDTIPVWYFQLSYLSLNNSDGPETTGPNFTYVLPKDIYHATGDYLRTGQVSFVYKLVNFRADFQFAFVVGSNPSNALQEPVIQALSPAITNHIVNFPTSVHLALDTDAQSIVVQFTSASAAPIPVRYGAMATALSSTVQSSSKTYTADMMCGGVAAGPGYRDVGYLHEAVLPASSLQSNRRHYYQIGDNSTGMTQVFSFVAPPPQGASASFKFLVFNDLGTTTPNIYNDVCTASGGVQCAVKPQHVENGTYFAAPDFSDGNSYYVNSTKLSNMLPKESDAQLALLVGDLSYAQGFAADWDQWLYQFQDSFSQWPLMVGIGNHERDWPNTGDAFNNTALDSGGECGVAYRYRMRPLSAAASNYSRDVDYYSFNFGNVHYLILDGETDTSPSSPQGKFVAADLAAVDRTKTPWTIVGIHRMMVAYPTSDNKGVKSDMYNQARYQQDLEDVFKKYPVDLVFSGHNHDYSRSCPFYKQNCTTYANTTTYTNAGAPVYILAGNGGAGFSGNFDYGYWARNNIKDYMVYGDNGNYNGYLRFTVNATTLHMDSVDAATGNVFDQLTLIKSSTPASRKLLVA